MQEKILALLKDRAYTIEELMPHFSDLKGLVLSLNEMIEAGLIFLEDDTALYRYIDGHHYFIALITYKNHALFARDQLFKDSCHLAPLNKDEGIFHLTKRGRLDLIKIYKRATVKLYGLLLPRRQHYFFQSQDRSFSAFRLENEKLGIKEPCYIEAYISDYRKKLCRFSKVIAKADDPKAKEMILLAKYQVPVRFPAKVLKESEHISPIKRTRVDFSDLLTVTIDGDRAKDFDDAISVEKKGNDYLLYVHIADVSSYVLKDSLLDKEALKRGNSLYYADEVTPMLPFVLSNELCSLKPNERRLTLSVKMLIDPKGEVIESEIMESVIISNYRLTYRKVEDHIDQKERFKDDALAKMIDLAYELSLILEKRRVHDGAIEFYDEESEFTYLDGRVYDLRAHKDLKSEKLIANFMIYANKTVAERMHYMGLPLIYRNHPYPKKEELEKFILILKGLGYEFKGKTSDLHSSQLALCLEHFKDQETFSLVNNLLLRAMAKALYQSEALGHYGLALEYYCHFTSPIRRYSDLVNHRLIRKYLFDQNFDDIAKDEGANDLIACRLNENEKKALDLERAMNKLKIAEYMAKHLGESYHGLISGVKPFGFFDKLDNTAEGLVSIKTLHDFYEFDEKLAILKGPRDSFRLGDEVVVKVVSVDMEKAAIDLVLKGK